MQIIENDKIKEKVYIKKLENGLTIMAIPKKGVQKKYIIWGTNYGSVDNHFMINDEEVLVPDGIAHYLEHKMFEQRNGKNSLDVLTSLGVDANAYTTNNYTAYLYECTDNFYQALDEFMDYVQNPYYTDENVEKERGIIEQEIMMYDDYPEWAMYMNAMKLMYHNNPINIDIAGTKESIAKIDKETLYKVYNNFYVPENMAIVVCGDIDENEIFGELEKRITIKANPNEVKRIIADEPENIVEKIKDENMDISMPIFMIGYKDKILNPKEMIKKDLAIEILLNIIIGKSSNLYKRLYEDGLIFSEFGFDYEFARNYAHVYIQGQSADIQKVITEMKNEFDYFINQGIKDSDFNRVKRKLYGEFVKSYNDVSSIGNSFIGKYFKGINLFDYLEEFESLNKEYVEEVLRNVFKEEKKVISIINPNVNQEEE
ncbi:MAG: insulinase family protein [Clostridia bacterium]|nr:insulinase family protein [Clostridia bacterium]